MLLSSNRYIPWNISEAFPKPCCQTLSLNMVLLLTRKMQALHGMSAWRQFLSVLGLSVFLHSGGLLASLMVLPSQVGSLWPLTGHREGPF